MKNQMKCTQCDKPAMFKAAGQLLCLNCFKNLQAIHVQEQEAQNENMRNLMSLYNLAASQFDVAAGMPGSTPKIQIPQPTIRPTIQEGPMTFNNFNINESTIGVINTGEVQRIDLAMGNLKKNSPELVKALGDFTQAILNTDQIHPTEKNELLEQVAEVSEQIALPPNKRKKGILKALVDGIQTTANTVTSVASAWSVLQPLITTII